MIRLTTFCDQRMTKALELCTTSAREHGVDRCYPWAKDMISGSNLSGHQKEFYLFNRDVLDQDRGAGYWLWKPYILMRALEQCEEGDILIYADAGVEFVANVNEVVSRMDENIFFFTNGFSHAEWCKWDVIEGINRNSLSYPKCGSDLDKEYGKKTQVQASVIFFKVNDNTRSFIKEWFLWCQMPGFIDDSPSKLTNYPTFAEHRHDQAILTCLQIKYGYKLHFWPTKYSEHIRHTARPEDNYPTLFNHHRKRDHEW
jgi:hypothetical protein